jgi:hypothetical protein
LPELLAQDLLDPGDSLINRLLGSDAVGGDAVDRLRPDPLLPNAPISPVARDAGVVVFHWARADLHYAGHPMRVARVKPERLIEQLLHRRQHPFTGEVEIVREPALGDEETDELLGVGDVAALLEHHSKIDVATNRKRPHHPGPVAIRWSRRS